MSNPQIGPPLRLLPLAPRAPQPHTGLTPRRPQPAREEDIEPTTPRSVTAVAELEREFNPNPPNFLHNIKLNTYTNKLDNTFLSKYLKYKTKYLNLKNQLGGVTHLAINNNPDLLTQIIDGLLPRRIGAVLLDREMNDGTPNTTASRRAMCHLIEECQTLPNRGFVDGMRYTRIGDSARYVVQKLGDYINDRHLYTVVDINEDGGDNVIYLHQFVRDDPDRPLMVEAFDEDFNIHG